MNWTTFLLGMLAGFGAFAFLGALAVAAGALVTKQAFSNPAVITAIVMQIMRGGSKNGNNQSSPVSSLFGATGSTGRTASIGNDCQDANAYELSDDPSRIR